MAYTKGEGRAFNDHCQMCATLLVAVCYSKNKNAKRVPRTNKICPKCFRTLPKFMQDEYARYEYRSHEARGTGWDPTEGWGG